jgi:hypothetical protein
MKLALALALVLASSGTLLAHPEGHGPRPAPTAASLDEEAAKRRGAEEVARLVSVKKIPESWKDAAKFNAIKKKGDAKKWEWLITYDNDKETSNKRLYVFLKPSGEFVAANFTGK